MRPRSAARGARALGRLLLLVGLLGALVAGAPAGVGPAAAADPPRCFGMLQYDLDSDGRPDLAVLDCAYATERDFVHVYDGAADMRPAERWQDVLDFRNDTWLFDAGADGVFDLAIVFALEDGREVAYLYDDQNRDGRVSVRRSGRRAIVDESPHWTARFESGSTWSLPDGSVNHNLRVLVDGPMSRFGFPETVLRGLATSGVPKWEAGISDADSDGVPEYSYSLLLAPSPADSQLPRTGFNVNTGRSRPRPADGFLFWPLLRGVDWYDRANYFDSPFTLTYDWQRRRLADVGLRGYPIEEGYHLNTLQYFRRGRVNFADFENPMAYYDLAGDRDSLPELFVRMAYFEQGPPLQEVTYSWNQYNSAYLHWHFKLGLIGRHPVNTQDQIGEFAVQTVPHADLPEWVTGRTWDIATFVAEEGGAYDSSEGIYEWAPLEGVIPDASVARTVVEGAEQAMGAFIQGRAAESPARYFDAIRAGFRAEYRETTAPATLYFSPLDRRLHLLQAQKGVWNLGDGREVRYAAVGGDHLNHWSLRLAGQPGQPGQPSQPGPEQRALWHVADQLVLADEAGVRLRRTDLPPVLFTTAPPVDNASWRALGQRLGDPDGPDAAAGADPRAMFDRVPGPALTLAGATVRDLRATAGGFRFVLTLPAGGTAAVPFTAGLPAGEYLVLYSPGAGYQAERLSPAGLSLGLAVEEQDTGAAAPQADTRQPLNLVARLTNGGQQDARNVRMQVVAAAAGQPEQVVGTATLDALAGGSGTVHFVWAAPAPGQWTLRARAAGAEGTSAEAATPLAVRPTRPPSAFALLTPQAPAVAGLLALLVGVGATGVALTLAALHGAGRREVSR